MKVSVLLMGGPSLQGWGRMNPQELLEHHLRVLLVRPLCQVCGGRRWRPGRVVGWVILAQADPTIVDPKEARLLVQLQCETCAQVLTFDYQQLLEWFPPGEPGAADSDHPREE